MRELEPSLPGGAEIVLERQKYWDAGFAELFLEYAEDLIFREPGAALKVADVARRLAHAVPVDRDPQGRRENREHLVRAYGLLGSARRTTGRLGDAADAYRKALSFCDRGVSRSCRGELYLQMVSLLAYRKRYDQALGLTEQAESLFRTERNEVGLGRVLATRGAVLVHADRFSEAVTTLSEALGGFRLTARVEFSATANLAHAVSHTDDPEGLESAQAQLRRARQLAGPRRSVQKSTLYWIEGRVFVRRGSTERAERCYKKALQGFVKFQTPYEIALAGLDLSSLYRFSKRWTELEVLAADTYRRFRDLQEDAEAVAALKLWLEGARERSLTIEAISRFKATLAERMSSHPAPRARPKT